MTHYSLIYQANGGSEQREAMTASRLLEKLEDFRLLPIFVIVSMAIGIAIGKALSISDFELTPPIDALKSIAAGTFELSVPSALSLGVPIGLFLMMYPAMTNVRLGEVGSAFRSPRQLGVVLLFNYLVAPFLMLLLANIFVSDPELHTGLVLYGLAPCIAMVIVFTYLAKGNVPMALVFVAINSVAQMLLIPVYARLLIGNVDFDVLVVGESVLLYLGLPLVAGVLTRIAVVRRGGEAAMERLKPGLSALSILGLLFTLTVMFSLKGDLILERPAIVVEMAIPMTIFFAAMFFVVLFSGSRLHFNYEDGVAVAFNTTGRDFEIAIAIAITAFSPTVALATVVGPLIEVPIMLFLVWAAMRLRPRLFPGAADGAAQDARGARAGSPERATP
jgi:arsenite transporter